MFGAAGAKAQITLLMSVLMLSIYCHSVSPAIHPLSKEWAFLVYCCADCDIEGIHLGNVVEMGMVGSTADVDIVVQIDRVDGYSTSYGDWTGCKRFYMTTGLTPTPENAIASLGEVNMGDPTTLRDFLTWAIQGYPANRYFLMMIGHGWIDGLCPDLTSHYDNLTPHEVQWALNQTHHTTGATVNIIASESCQQSALEIAYEIGGYFSPDPPSPDIVIASEEVSTVWPFKNILTDLVTSPTMDSTSIASMIVDHYSQWPSGGLLMTMAAFNMTTLGTTVATATSNLAETLIANVTRYGHDILAAASRAESHSPLLVSEDHAASCRDLFDFAYEIKREIADSSIQLAAQNLMNAIEDACIAEWHGAGHPDFHGLYIYLPCDAAVYNARASLFGSRYDVAHSGWTQDTAWDELLHTLHSVYAEGLRSRERIQELLCTSFDSDDDGFLDATHLELMASTSGEPINVTASGVLIDPQGNVVDQQNSTWTVDAAGCMGTLDLHMAPGGEAGLYDVKVSLYDAYGILEDEIHVLDAAYLPEPMVHDVAVTEVVSLKTIVGEGFEGSVCIMLQNEGHYLENCTVTVHADDAAFNVTQIQLRRGEVLTVTILWHTAGWALGNYTIGASIDPVSEEADVLDNTLYASLETYITIPGDVDADFDVDIYDVVQLSDVYGALQGDSGFLPNCDIDGDADVDIYDIVLAAGNYGESW